MQDLYKVSDWLSGLTHEPRDEERMPALSSLALRREVAVERNDIQCVQCKSLDTVLFLCYDYISCTGHYIALSPQQGYLATMNWEKNHRYVVLSGTWSGPRRNLDANNQERVKAFPSLSVEISLLPVWSEQQRTRSTLASWQTVSKTESSYSPYPNISQQEKADIEAIPS